MMNELATLLKEQVDTKGYIDVGTGVENPLGVGIGELRTAVHMLKEQGYVVLTVKVKRNDSDDDVLVKLLASPGTTYKDLVVKLK